MKVKAIVPIALSFLVIFAGCMKLEGYNVLSKSDGMDGAFRDNRLIIGIFVPGWPGKYEIDQTRSFLSNPSGDRSQFTTEMYNAGYGNNSPYLKIYRLDNEGKKCYAWKTGVWKIRVVLKDDKTEIIEEMEIHIANMYWSPFIHGVPK